MSSGEFTQFDRELELDRCLSEHGVPPLDGLSTTEQRREAARAAILANELAAVICGRSAFSNKPVTYAEAFAITYGVPLKAAPSDPIFEPPAQTSAHPHTQGKLL